MPLLKVEIVKRSCALILEIADPTETLKRLAMFFQDRQILIENLQLHRYNSGNAQLIFQCLIERDRIHRTVQLLHELPGIIELEWLERKGY